MRCGSGLGLLKICEVHIPSSEGTRDIFPVGVSFISLREQIDTGTPTGKMVFTILGSVAELERSLIGERVKAGLRNARAHGVKLGRPPLRVLSMAEVQQLRRERKKTGESFKGLAQRYGISVWTAFHLCKPKGL